MNKLINLLSILACLCSACGLDKSQTHTHRFTMTCKVDCIREQFITEEGRQKALRFFKDHHVELVYLESYRHGVSVSSEILEEVKHAFEKAGIQCAGCITTTQIFIPAGIFNDNFTVWIDGFCSCQNIFFRDFHHVFQSKLFPGTVTFSVLT